MNNNAKALIGALQRERDRYREGFTRQLEINADLQQRLDDLLRPQILKNTCRQPEVRVNDRSTEAKKDGGKLDLTPANAA